MIINPPICCEYDNFFLSLWSKIFIPMETYRVMVYLKNDTIETTVQAKSPSQAKAIAESMYKDAKITILL